MTRRRAYAAIAMAIAGFVETGHAQQRPHPAVCRVLVDEAGGMSLGSGTLIDARERFGLVVTNWHVVRDATGKIETVFPDGFRSVARPLKLDETWDLAALVIWRPPATPVQLATSPPRPGEPLTICGYGRGLYRAAPGRCTDYYAPEIGLPHEIVELDVEARQGDSGGPIFNASGKLAGVLFGAGRGTTLGSFQGRVKTFLASVAPNVGEPSLLAGARPRGPRALLEPPRLASDPTSEPAIAAKPIDEQKGNDAARLAAVEPVERVAAGPTRKTSLDTPAPPDAWFSPTRPPSPSVAPTLAVPPGFDLLEDGRSLLALGGVAAIVAALLRSGG